MITPAPNTVLEPVTYRLVKDLPDVSVHFSRIAVSHVGLDQASADQLTFEHLLNAAQLLADARVQAIAWNGTSGSWMGVAPERHLCQRLEQALAVPVTTSTLAMLEAFRELGVERYSLAVPYPKPMADRIVEVYRAEGFECVRAVFRRWTTVREIGAMTESVVKDLLESAVHPDSQGIALVCTNVLGAPHVEEVEKRHKTTVFDSVLVTAWKCFQMVGLENLYVKGWGRLLSGARRPPHRERLVPS